MLDSETKRRIDTARDILVGKVPDPKSQVEQITIALIYKFMDDMDKEAVSFGGEATFFTGEYEKYSWTKIFDPKLGGHEMLNLYGEAIVKLNVNPNIPQLFRDIFKNAYLPYRDPETLKLFLKTINDFSYDHSEMLGDAFEYLLSVLGSQGDAGQFRTPRHIIDFLVAVVDPKKGETINDPACGTAGFLISAYKHIIAQNTKKQKGDLLTPDDRRKMIQNFVGYDISPDMVRLSLVNMYLHGFTTPKIFEYDTLTSEDRWGDYFDVILANPPFMTPKGGIKPHKKFTVQASKSEVLFTDYIAEHIHPSTGRAAIIVPNGIVATSQTAYKELRKLMVNQSLIAVISLPAGVFQPYSGVKTSVLLLDKRLSKKTDNVLFIKIENDGFDLGAQRREIEKNDLPPALELLKAYKEALANNRAIPELPSMATLVTRETIRANKDIVLSAERYFENKAAQTEFELVKLGDERYFKVESGGTPSSEIQEYWNGNVKWATLVDLPAQNFITSITNTERSISELGLAKSSAKIIPINSVIVSSRATIGRIAINKIPLATNQGFKNIIIQDFNSVLPEYLAYVLTQKVEEMTEIATGGTFKEISKSNFCELEIPLPPIEIQQQIVLEIDGYQRIMDGARMVVENYKPTFTIKPEWEMVELGEVFKTSSGGTPLRSNNEFYDNGIIPWLKSGEVAQGFIYSAEEYITDLGLKNSSAKLFPVNSVLVAMYGATAGQVGILKFEATTNQAVCGILPNEKVIPEFLYFTLKGKTQEFVDLSTGGAQPNISQQIIRSFKIPIPSINEQAGVVKALKEEIQIVEQNKRLIELFEAKIKNKIAEVWGVEVEELAETKECITI